MDHLDHSEVARRAGVAQSVVRALVASGILASDSEGRFQAADIARVRLVDALLSAGVELEDVATAVAGGRLSFRFVDLLMPDPVSLVTPSRESEPALDLVDSIRPVLGTTRVTEDSIREDDLAILTVLHRAIQIGAPLDTVIGIVRSMARSARMLTDLQRDFIDEVLLNPAIEESGSPVTALEITSQNRLEFRELGRRLIALLMERFVDDAIFANLVELTEAALSAGGIHAPDSRQAVAFIDVSNYTSLSESHGDRASAVQSSRLADFIEQVAHRHGARLVKTLGDGAMVHASNSRAALGVALDAVSGAAAAGVWALHAGVNTGPMIRRDGDFFGAAVNVASRVADRAGQGEVVVTDTVAEALADDDNLVFEPLGAYTLKNVADPVNLLRAVRRL
jgi:adenylate cyclase